jgi:RNA polymerase sigma-70 factor, ECF subfamily
VAPGEQTDVELVLLAQEGDLEAFAEIVRRHERRLRIVLLRVLDDTRDVEEAVKQHPTTDLESLPAEGASLVAHDVLPEAATEANETRERVLAALAALPFEHREAVVLRDLASLSNEEVAAALDVTLAAAKSRIHRGRLALREELEPHKDS